MAGFNLGDIVVQLKADAANLQAGIALAEKEISGFAGSTVKKTSVMHKGFENLSKYAMGGVIAASVAVGAAIIKNVGNAVKRVDTLNNFPKVMANLGYGADEAKKAIDKLDKGVQGLPTSLNDIASAMQNIAPSTKSLDEATDIALALNNALIAGGQSTEIQATAMQQFSQAISKGKPDMIEWRSLATAMPGQLDQITQSLGYGRGEWQKMAGDVSAGRLPFKDVTQAIVDLNNKGLGKFPSFADQAKNASGGLQTAIANANTAITRGIGKVITAIGSSGVANAIASFGRLIEKGLTKTADFITRFVDYLKNNESALWAFAGAVAGLGVALLVSLAPAIWGVVTAIGAAVVAAAPFIAVGAAIGAIALIIKNNWDKIEPTWNKVVEAAKKVWHWFNNNIMPILKAIGSFVANQFKAAWNDLKKAFDDIVKALAPYKDQLKILAIILGVVLLTPLLVVIATVVAFIAVVTAVITVGARLIGWIAKAIAWFLNFSNTVKNKTKEAFNSAKDSIGKVIEVIKSLPSKAARALGNLGSTLYQKGKDLIQGLINGAGSMLSNLASFFLDKVPGPLKTAFKKALGISSPSKVFAEYGKNIVQGLTQGIDANLAMATSSVNNLALAPTKASAVGLQSQNNSFSTNITGPMYIGNQQDADYLFKKINRDQQLAGMGLR